MNTTLAVSGEWITAAPPNGATMSPGRQKPEGRGEQRQRAKLRAQ